MNEVGIDALAFYTPRYALDLAALAAARGVDPHKFITGLNQQQMSVPPPGEDIVTMAANAAQQILTDVNKEGIDLLLFATESGIDQSKAAGLYIHHLLQLPTRCRIVELKQACYAGTAGLQLALPYLRENPDKKVLLIASDIARYGLNSVGESSQGAGAVAMLLSSQPRLLYLERAFGVVSENVMDFWRPNYLDEALVDGKYSSKIYLNMLEKAWSQYQGLSQRSFSDHDYFCYHTPVPRLVEKAHQYLLKINGKNDVRSAEQLNAVAKSIAYGCQIGNTYTASLYIALASLFDNTSADLTGKRIGFYSYGSGCVAEFFSGVVQPNYQKNLHTTYHKNLLSSRTTLSFNMYETFYQFNYVQDGSHQDVPAYRIGGFRLTRMENHKRIYEPSTIKALAGLEAKQTEAAPIHVKPMRNIGSVIEEVATIKVMAPGKLILSGEHNVVYGNPALAMAINRFVTATITKTPQEHRLPQIMFDLSDLAYSSRLSLSGLKALKARIKDKYHRFIKGDFSIREVLQKPFELVQFALGMFAETLHQSLPDGMKLHLESNIPIGCGMGSSAATILSVMKAVSNYLQTPLSQETLFKLALEAENMQHGFSSGLDLEVALQGGCIYKHGEMIEKRFVPMTSMFLVNTGVPCTNTGQTIESVAPVMRSKDFQAEFSGITQTMDKALKKQAWDELNLAIMKNHRLLIRLGVVPEQVQQFIAKVENMGASAKVCGAGATAGSAAGAIWVYFRDPITSSQQMENLSALCHQFGYTIIPVSGEMRGVHAA